MQDTPLHNPGEREAGCMQDTPLHNPGENARLDDERGHL